MRLPELGVYWLSHYSHKVFSESRALMWVSVRLKAVEPWPLGPHTLEKLSAAASRALRSHVIHLLALCLWIPHNYELGQCADCVSESVCRGKAKQSPGGNAPSCSSF